MKIPSEIGDRASLAELARLDFKMQSAYKDYYKPLNTTRRQQKDDEQSFMFKILRMASALHHHDRLSCPNAPLPRGYKLEPP